MKKILFFVALFVAASVQQSVGQSSKTDLTQFLSLYFEMKDALVAGNAATAAAKAEAFVKATNGSDATVLIAESRDALVKDATAISVTNDIKEQRIRFSPLSDNMISLAKASKLSAEPIYIQYCPMKKASWLSSQQAVRNPYYGSAMLACGKVTATL